MTESKPNQASLALPYITHPGQPNGVRKRKETGDETKKRGASLECIKNYSRYFTVGKVRYMIFTVP